MIAKKTQYDSINTYKNYKLGGRKMFKETLKRNKGITLIALVVTIIVLLILAGISISMLSGQNSTLNRAREAKGEYSNSTEKEQIQLSYNSAITKKIGESITAEELQNELNGVVGKNEDGTSKAEVTDKGNGVFNVKFIKTNHNYKVDNGDVTLLVEEDKSVVEPENIADWEYDSNDDGTLTITGYKGRDTEVVIPNYINGVKVKKLEKEGGYSIWSDNILNVNGAFNIGSAYRKGQNTIEKVTISYGIEEVGEYAFAGTINMKNVSIPTSVTTIGVYAFYACSGLTNVTIPSSVTIIKVGTFYMCSSLKDVTIPSSVTEIGNYAFRSCSSLENITIPSSVTMIDDGAFESCSNLTSITIPSSVTSIKNVVFCECSSLKDVTIPSSVTEIGINAFGSCSSLKNITIPSSVTSIKTNAFSSCSNLTSITIPSKVTEMGPRVFDRIPSITVTVPYKLGESLPSGWNSAWNETNSDCKVKIKYQQ